MAHVNVDQYITTAQTAARVQRLNQAVLEMDVLPIIGGSGSGKRAFLEMKAAGFTRAALPEAMVYEPLADRKEFAQIIARLVRNNLHAVPAADLAMNEIAARFNEWAGRDWFLRRAPSRVADTCLGPQRGDASRQFTRNVLDCIEQTWLKRAAGSG